MTPFWDYPRMCGEKLLLFPYLAVGQGITPACAGKRVTERTRRKRKWDHPRMCGEKSSILCQDFFQKGSPPHVRGKAFFADLTGKIPGITPACAGKSPIRYYITRSSRDHPRMCGEKLFSFQGTTLGKGSPPHVRGKDFESLENQALE